MSDKNDNDNFGILLTAGLGLTAIGVAGFCAEDHKFWIAGSSLLIGCLMLYAVWKALTE